MGSVKTIVYDQDFNELEIKPREEVARYREVLDQEVRSRLAAPAVLQPRPCPACGASEGRPAYEKSGLHYRECPACATLYVSPAPLEEALRSFFEGSEAVRFWNQRIWAGTREVRRRRIHAPLAAWIIATLDRHLPEARWTVDLSWHGRPLIEELRDQGAPLTRITAAGPMAAQEFVGFEGDGIELRVVAPGQIPEAGAVDAVTAFDSLPRAADVDRFMTTMSELLRPGGLLFLTAVSVDGFDLQVLWNDASSVHPPDRINLFSVEGLERMAERHGFEVLEFSTPGAFDVSVVRQAMLMDPEADVPRFVRSLLRRGEEATEDFQVFLQHHRLSSHARLALRRPRP